MVSSILLLFLDYARFDGKTCQLAVATIGKALHTTVEIKNETGLCIHVIDLSTLVQNHILCSSF